jgi:hypothetical protein
MSLFESTLLLLAIALVLSLYAASVDQFGAQES